MSESSMETDLADWGKVIRLTTVGRRSGLQRTVSIGFLAETDGSLLVAAASDTTGWATNLRPEPGCSVELDGHRQRWHAELLVEPERSAAITALILKYGTPAERLGGGPAYRLLPGS